MKIFYTIIKIIILLIFLILALSNMQSVQFFYLPAQSIDMPLILVLFGAFVTGSVFGIFALFGRLLTLRSENSRLRAEVKKSARTASGLAVPQPQDPAPAPLERKE
ncbi:lipopolysaccharide assembly LapA domain-containing protein [Neisseria sp.]|uniref:LapA family protein n=1 Tax=Neisseria sp. TaxID=192066 RepID=UPI0026DBF930|nr:lipopolysaccharide assembly protein LapA domain-containing protein [Neisseria sp.]MDO4906661.1 lipopolysaccharide assembly protein LapA domain-containing protein [Neisseria sp.]